MKKLLFLPLIFLLSFAIAQDTEIVPGYTLAINTTPSPNNVLIYDGTTNIVAREIGAMYFFTPRVLTQEERDSLVNDLDFRKKCEWAITDYSSYWINHDGSGLDTDARAKWRREYELVKQVWKSEYNDPVLAKRFVTLAKGRQYNVDSTPTINEIIALMVADGSFDAIASQYFDMLTER